MRIANPLYDHAFKYLMSNNRLARKVLSVILDKEVVALEPRQQEIVIEDELRQFTLYRLDFKAQIMDQSGRQETVIIELQKSKLPTNTLRFRDYLGLNYRTQKKDKAGVIQEAESAYPIISIYILGYNIEDIPVMATKVDRKIMDVSRNVELHIQSDFIDLLTHTCYILQVRRLPAERRTRIEQFMTLFNQVWIREESYILDLEDVPEEFKDVAEYLQRPLLEKDVREKLDAEQVLQEMFAEQEAEVKMMANLLNTARTEVEKAQAEKEKAQAEKEKAQAEVEKAQAEKEKAQAEKEKAQAEKEKAQAEKEKAQAEKEKAQAEKEKAQADAEKAKADAEKERLEKEATQNQLQAQNQKLARMMFQSGMAKADIAKELSLSEQAISSLLAD